MRDHTPLPWVAGDSEHGTYPIWAKCGPLNVQPATAHGSDDAAFIVKAVNSHDDLVKALEGLLIACECEHDLTEAFKTSRAALASIKVQP